MVREGTADAELLFKRPMNFTRPMLNSPTQGTAAGDAFYTSVVRRVAAWQDSWEAYIKMAHVCDRRNEQMMRQEIRCNCLTCRDVH
jgi:hypothetical protein